jgi:hypothetical protein
MTSRMIPEECDAVFRKDHAHDQRLMRSAEKLHGRDRIPLQSKSR